MTHEFRSSTLLPRARGEEFGETHRDRIAATVDTYDALFASRQPADWRETRDSVAAQTLQVVGRWSPDLSDELAGMARAAGQPVEQLAAVNARTEVLAALGPSGRGECSTVVSLGDEFDEPVAVQNWDWFAGLAEDWLVWTIPHPDGRITTTVTEYGILGKIGINSAGVGLLFNILHHVEDGTRRDGVPVHVLARHVLDTANDANTALLAISDAPVTASTALTVVTGTAAGKTAITAEVWPSGPSHVLPTPAGLLLHTNHFLAGEARGGDTEPREAPDTLIRYEVLQRSLHHAGDKVTTDVVREVLTSHVGGTGAICCHPSADEPAAGQYATLATVELDFAARTLRATAGPPCGHRSAPDHRS